MLKFFRKIRQNLLLENKTGKYFKYAIGEIVLVVIGILIALQINNWNEERKDRIREQAILNQLKTEFKNNLTQLDQKNKSKRESINSALQLIKYIDFISLRNKDSVNYHLVRTIPFTTFDPIINDLVSSGELRIIKNDSLKQKLTFWTSETADLREEELSWQNYRDNRYEPFLVEYYQLRTIRNLANNTNVLDKYLIEGNLTARPEIGNSTHTEDYNSLLNNPDFEDHIERCLTKNNHSLNQSLILRKKIVEIIDLIEQNLE